MPTRRQFLKGASSGLIITGGTWPMWPRATGAGLSSGPVSLKTPQRSAEIPKSVDAAPRMVPAWDFEPGFLLQRTGVKYGTFAEMHAAANDGDVVLVGPAIYDLPFSGARSTWPLWKSLTLR